MYTEAGGGGGGGGGGGFFGCGGGGVGLGGRLMREMGDIRGFSQDAGGKKDGEKKGPKRWIQKGLQTLSPSY